jgi:hypothetical protein
MNILQNVISGLMSDGNGSQTDDYDREAARLRAQARGLAQYLADRRENVDVLVAIELKESYGIQRAYPVSDQARLLAEMCGKKTLTGRTLQIASRMGFAIVDAKSAQPLSDGELLSIL